MTKRNVIFKAIIFTLLTSLLSSCVTGPEGYMKRSANNKLFDRKGFKGGKRSPLYNKKYIAQAKKNVINGEYDEELFDDDDMDENENTSRENIEMYKAMIEADMANERKQRKKRKNRTYSSDRAYPSIVNANSRLAPRTHADTLELKEELEQIRELLEGAKKDLGSYKCPTARQQEMKSTKKTRSSKNRPRESLELKELKDSPMNVDPETFNPIKSI